MLEGASADLVLAVDSFPYLVSAGLAEAHVREAARVLAPGGDLVVFNWSYVGDHTQQSEAFHVVCQVAGLQPLYVGRQTLSTWDGVAFTARAN
jgi:SAM-dependent methyltransferase